MSDAILPPRRAEFSITAGRLAPELIARYDGEFFATRHDGASSESYITIDRADPCIRISGAALSGFSELHRVGNLVRIEAANRTVVYRLKYYDIERDVYLAVWPD